MCCWLVKYGLFFSNLVFTLGGLALIGVGVATLLTDVLKVISTDVHAIPITIIVLGALIFLIAFLGCCGAIRENRCFLTLYGICVMVLAAGKIYVAVVLFRNLSDIRELVKEWLGEAFSNMEIREQFHVMETTMITLLTVSMLRDERSNLLLRQASRLLLPPSEQTCDAASAFEGCNELVGDFFEIYTEVIGIVVVVIVAVECLAVVLSLGLCSTIGSRQKRTV